MKQFRAAPRHHRRLDSLEEPRNSAEAVVVAGSTPRFRSDQADVGLLRQVDDQILKGIDISIAARRMHICSAVAGRPNLVARLQALAGPGSVKIAGSTLKLIGNLFDLEDLGPHEAQRACGTGARICSTAVEQAHR
jgi:hypothetical protein